jgi:hypothetical protein
MTNTIEVLPAVNSPSDLDPIEIHQQICANLPGKFAQGKFARPNSRNTNIHGVSVSLSLSFKCCRIVGWTLFVITCNGTQSPFALDPVSSLFLFLPFFFRLALDDVMCES